MRHSLHYLRLTHLAQAGWKLHVLSAYAGHPNPLFFMLLSCQFLDTGRDDDKTKILWVSALLSILILMTKPMAFYLPVLLSAVFVLPAISQFLSDSKHSRARTIVQFHSVLVLITLLTYACLVIPDFKFFKTYIAYALGLLWTHDVSLSIQSSSTGDFRPTPTSSCSEWDSNY